MLRDVFIPISPEKELPFPSTSPPLSRYKLQPALSPAASTDECLQQRTRKSPQAGRGGRGPPRQSIPRECGKSYSLRMNEEAWEPRGGNDSIWRKVAFALGFQEWRGVSGREAVYCETRVLRRSRRLTQGNGSRGGTMLPGDTVELRRGGSMSSSKEL